jgi:hypothetical protein
MLFLVTFATLVVPANVARAQQKKIGYDDSPMQPNGKWHVHDG